MNMTFAERLAIARALPENKGKALAAGEWILVTHTADPTDPTRPLPGTARHRAEFPNLITNTGLDMIGLGRDLSSCVVGSGSATPAFTDSSLQTLVAGSNGLQSNTLSYNAVPEYGQSVRTWRFAAGVAAGNLSEIGVAGAVNGTFLFSRALILDGGGSPTTITILSTEILDCVYVLRMNPPAADFSANVVVQGVTYNYTARPANVTTWQNFMSSMSTGSPSVIAYDGGLGSRSGQPTGNASGGSAATNSYSNGTKSLSFTTTFAIGSANFGNGVKAIYLGSAIGNWQFSIDAGANIPKTSNQVLTCNFTVSWDRV